MFTNTGRAGGCPSQSEATARLVSIALRAGIDEEAIVEQLKGIRCPSTIRQRNINVFSCPDAIGRMIEKVMNHRNGNGDVYKVAAPLKATMQVPRPYANTSSYGRDEISATSEKSLDDFAQGSCPECGYKLEHEGGCVVCRNCGYSKCG